MRACSRPATSACGCRWKEWPHRTDGHLERSCAAARAIRSADPRASLYRGFVEIAGGDDLPFDDRRWLAFDVRRPDQVLLVDGQPGASVFGNETYYLETALRLRLPDEESKASPTPFAPVRQAWSGPGGTLPDLSPFRVVALCNVADVSPAAAGALRGSSPRAELDHLHGGPGQIGAIVTRRRQTPAAA